MSFDPRDPIGSVFANVIGKPCWGAQPGHGSAIIFNFGEPHLEIREPILAKPESSPKVRELLARRNVMLIGQWRMLIEFCDWTYTSKGKAMMSSESDETEMRAGLDLLDGEQLIRVSVDPSRGRSTFEFDLGGRIETEPGEVEAVSWYFFTPDNRTLCYRGDGMYSWGKADEKREQEVWLPVPINSPSD